MGIGGLGPGYLCGMISSPTTEPLRSRLASGSWWFRSSDGTSTLWQFPNPALSVWIGAVLLGMFHLSSTHTTTVDGIRHGALLVWSLDELVRGASPFRRTLGAVVLVGQIALLVLA